jgi:hypothetical protein
MTDRELLLKMAAYIRANGFDPHWTRGKDTWNHTDCGCFLHAARAVVGEGHSYEVPLALREVVGTVSMMERPLERAGWTGPEVTDDAVAACLIAADLCS